MAIIRPFAGKTPNVHESAFVADGAVVVGDVEIAADVSLWFGAVVRGDVNFIRIGARTNVQDYSVLHVTSRTHPPVVGPEGTPGPRAPPPGCPAPHRCPAG